MIVCFTNSVLLFSNCKTKENKKESKVNNEVTYFKNQDSVAAKIVNLFGGDCEYGVDKEVYENGIEEYAAWFKFENSPILNKNTFESEILASNIAIIAVSDLKNKPANFSKVICYLPTDSNRKFIFEISLTELAKTKLKAIDTVSALLEQKKYDHLLSLFSNADTLTNTNKKQILNTIKVTEAKLGPGNGTVFFGYSFKPIEKDRLALNLYFKIKREKGLSEICITLNPYSENTEIYSINYNFKK